jgi:DNA-binding NarL/FixJ family response regulator
MTMVLIIDDDASARAYLRSAAPPAWTLLEAQDGLQGLNLVSKHGAALDLVVLDIAMPGVDGRVVCSRIRELVPTLPILPFTGVPLTEPVLTALGCLPPLLKPVRPGDLALALRAALTQPAPTVGEHPLIAWAHEQSKQIEQLVRHNLAVPRVVIYAISPVMRAGLVRMLSSAAQTVEAASDGALRTLLAGIRWTALIASANDYLPISQLTSQYAVPLVLLADSPTQARMVAPRAASVLLATDAALGAKLAAVLEALTVGDAPPSDALAGLADLTTRGNMLPRELLLRLRDTPLSARELEVLWLDHHGYTRAQTAQLLGLVPGTVASHWKHIQRKLGRKRQAARAWFQAQLNATATPGAPNE